MKWIEFAFSLVEEALSNYGIGGKIRAGYGKMNLVLSDEEKKRKDDESKRAKYREKGFMFIEGDEVEVTCVKVETNKKGKKKQHFVFRENCGDTNAIHFNPKIEISEGESARGIIIDIANNSYTLRRL